MFDINESQLEKRQFTSYLDHHANFSQFDRGRLFSSLCHTVSNNFVTWHPMPWSDFAI